MLGLRVTVPVACFRKGLAREYLETEQLPPPATCYGFLLSLVGETDRRRHIHMNMNLLKKPSSRYFVTCHRYFSKTSECDGTIRPLVDTRRK